MIRILLTSSVGGADTNWRNRLLGKTILAVQKLKEADGRAKFSHCELITSEEGHTFGARWRTREREPDKGLYAYVGAYVMIARPKMTAPQEVVSYSLTRSEFNGDVYPVHRIILQGLSALVFPWLSKIGCGKFAVCSEVVAYFLNRAKLRDYWMGTTPAQLEDEIRNQPHKYEILFEGVLKDGLKDTNKLKESVK